MSELGSIKFNDEDSFGKAYRETTKFNTDQDTANLANDYARQSMPSRLRQQDATANLTTAHADLAQKTMPYDVSKAQSSAGIEGSRFRTAVAEEPYAAPLKAAAVEQAQANVGTTRGQHFQNAVKLLDAGQDDAAEEYAKRAGEPMPQIVLQNGRVRAEVSALAKRAKIYGDTRPDLEQQYIEAGLKELRRRIDSGELVNDPTQSTLPLGAPAPVSLEKPVNVPAGSMSIRPSTGEIIAQNRGATFDTAALDHLAEQYMAGDKSVFQNLGRGQQAADNIIALRQRVVEKMTQRGMGGADQAAALANFGAQSAAARTAAVREGNVQSSVEEARYTFPLALEASAHVPRTDWVPFNRAVQLVQAGFSSPPLAQFVTATQGVITAYSQAMSRTGTNTVHAQQSAEHLLSAATGPEAYAATLAQMEKEMQAAVKAPETVRQMILQRISGRTPAPVAPAAQRPDMMTPGDGGRPLNIAAPPRPASVPPGSAYSPSTQMWRSSDGRIFDQNGQPVHQ